jgi:SAM-dependent methyltransferase
VTRIDLDHARRRAKELLKAAKAGDAAAVARLPRRHEPIVLADAQLAIARELGFPSWPKLVESHGWTKATYDTVDWAKVARVTLVPFLENHDEVVIPDEGLPSDELRPGEDAVIDAPLRIALEQAGFRRQGTHVFAVGEGGTHVAIWIEGYRYTGRRPHRRDAQWWTGDPREVDEALVRMADDARRALTHEERVEDMRRILDVSYLTADTPWGGSGYSGTREEWDANHAHIVDAVERDGTFLDVGCANGFLMECMVDWCAARGIALEPYGLDISPALADRARERLPQWADRIWVGDARTWSPPRTFDVVHALLDTVRPAERGALVEHLLTFVAPDGRLVLSHYSPTLAARDEAQRLGHAIDGEGSNGIGVWIRKPVAVSDRPRTR